MMNREAPPFDNPELRRAVALTLDRKAFLDTLTLDKGDLGGAMLPPTEGVWGMPAEMLKSLPGYDPDMPTNRAEACKTMEKLSRQSISGRGAAAMAWRRPAPIVP
jgi:peptide/nickel transport system substrate-binding protein